MSRKQAYKRIQNFAVLFSIMFFAVLSYGCSSGGSSTTNNYRTGTKGIEINYALSSPPSEVYYSTGAPADVPVTLEMWNRGAESGSGTVFFDGYDPSMFALPSSKAFSVLEGKEESRNPQGTNAYLDMGSVNVNLPTDVDSINIPLRATACYDYSTIATVNVCVDPNPSKPGTRACTPVSNPSVSGGQGGPVAISSIQYEAGKGQAIFTITIRNVGGGQVFLKGKTGTCMSATQAELDVIGVSGTISRSALSCISGKGGVRLINNEAIVVCRATGLNVDQGAYSTPITLTLTYGYKYSTQKNIQVKRI
jgi:hypothetical protein